MKTKQKPKSKRERVDNLVINATRRLRRAVDARAAAKTKKKTKRK